MNITVYSTDPPCPKCKVLEKKLDEAGIKYDVINDTDTLKSIGFEYFPVMKIDNTILNFKQAIDWIKNRR